MSHPPENQPSPNEQSSTPAPSGVLTRSKRRLNVASTSTTKQSDFDFLSTSDSDDAPPKKKKVKSKAKNTKQKGRPSTGRRRVAGRLANLMIMPMDVFFEIVSHLEPLDLLHLARANKFLRSILFTRSSKHMWVSARNNLDHLPECSSDLSEPAYASMLFESICMVCGSPRATKVDWVNKIRACHKHWEEAGMTYNDIRAYVGNGDFATIIDMLPHPMTTGPMIVFRTSLVHQVVQGYNNAKLDLSRCLQYKNEQQQRNKQIIEEASNIFDWKINQGNKKAAKNKAVMTSRKNSIEQKLRNLGHDLRDICAADYEKEYRRMVNQPTALTPMIWNRVRPKLEEIVVACKGRRLISEKEDRKQARRREVILHLSLFIDDDIKDGAHAPFPEIDWIWTFPVGAALYDLPSVAPFIETDEVKITEELWRAKKEEIMADIRVYQMKCRRFLAAGIAHAKLSPSSGPLQLISSHVVSDEEIDLDTLRADDEKNIAILCEPTALFRDSHGPANENLFTYPHVLKSDASLRRVKVAKEAWDTSSKLLVALGMDAEASIGHIMRQKLLCKCCHPSTARILTWTNLIQHYENETLWFVTESRKFETLNILGTEPGFEVVNDHSLPFQAVILTPEEELAAKEVVESADAADPSMAVWTCKHCSRRPPSNIYDLPLRTKKNAALLHVQIKHGIPENNAEQHVAQTFRNSFLDFLHNESLFFAGGDDEMYDSEDDSYGGIWDADPGPFYDSEDFEDEYGDGDSWGFEGFGGFDF